MIRITCFVLVLTFASCGFAGEINRSILNSILHGQDMETVSALKLLMDKGYLEELKTFEVEQVLEKALAAQDLKAANALSLLREKGILTKLLKGKAKASATSSEEISNSLKGLLEQIYGSNGDGYMYLKDALGNEKVDLRWVEIYTVKKLQDKGDGWMSMEIGLGSLEEIETVIPLRINVKTGEAIEFPNNEDLKKVRQLKI